MALLQYKCTGCNLEFEQLVKDSLQDVFCPKCKEKQKGFIADKCFPQREKPPKNARGIAKLVPGANKR